VTAVISAICVYVCVGMRKDGLSLALSDIFRAHVRPMDITGKPMKGWIMVGPDGIEKKADLLRYADAALSFVESLTAK
jgi:hypothetical protein